MSDLISKRELYHKIAETYNKGRLSWGANEIFKDIIGECDSVENNGEFEGMTNGEVLNLILREIFPRIIFIRGVDERNKTKSIVYSEEWENEPYKAERG